MRQDSLTLSEVYQHWQQSRVLLLHSLQPSSLVASHSSPSPEQVSHIIANQIFELLGQRTFPSRLEADLLTLRQLFVDFDEIQTHREQRLCLTKAHDILRRLHVQAGIERKLSGQKTIRSEEGSVECAQSALHNPGLDELWNIPIRFGKGVGPSRAVLLRKLGVVTIEDAFWSIPWRYEDWTEIIPIKDLRLAMKAIVGGHVTACRLRRTSRKGMIIVTVSLEDETGPLEAVFFNQPFLEQILRPGVLVMLCGEVGSGNSRQALFQMRAPQYEIIRNEQEGTDRLRRVIPIYHETKGMSSRQFRRILHSLHERYAESIKEILPASLRDDLGMTTLHDAVKTLHFPDNASNVDTLNQGSTLAHQRLAFEELLLLQLALAIRRREGKQETMGIKFTPHGNLIERFHSLLPFKLTASQQRVIQEIQTDMMRSSPMNRLLQGDVGSGKTMVALHAMILACGSGYQAVLMAPTEVLSEQHFLTLQPYFSSLELKAVFVKGGQSRQERSKALKQLELGEAHVAVGTHALLQKEVVFKNLGLVVVDEQHKFGVVQRAVLREKGRYQPDVLVMTATPIPRTLAMTVYGDLDVSVIDKLPPDRKPVQTLVFQSEEREDAYNRLRQEVQAGRQGYVVYPLVEPSEKIDLQAAVEAADSLKENFPEYKIGLLHGRMKSKEKQATMNEFKDGMIHILVTTTVIEVGVDVSNASVILIEHAERFGLAQLHQLRGRVGRGADHALCLLVRSPVKSASGEEALAKESQLPFPQPSPDMRTTDKAYGVKMLSSQESQRLQIFARCRNGFTLAEEDLKIRGPGNVLGEQQWGLVDFRVANVQRDYQLIILARNTVEQLLAKDPNLNSAELGELKMAMLRKWGKTLKLGSVG